jgi:hypothetical protein
MKHYFRTLIEACEYIAVNNLDKYMVVLAPDFGRWLVVNSANEVEYTIDALTTETGLVSDPHYAADSTHTPLTPDVLCPECQRLGWVNAPILVEFISVAGAA